MLLWAIFNASCALYHSRDEQEYIEIFLFPELKKINLFLNFIWELLYNMFLRKLPLLEALLFHKITINLLVWYTFGFDLEEKLEKERNIRKTQAN